MIPILFIVAGAVILWILRQCWPVHGLIEVKQLDCIEAKGSNRTFILLDVRDASKYLTGHIPGSINISTGRLPYVWQLNLSKDDDVVILSENPHQRDKSARILRKHGFRHLYKWHGGITDSPITVIDRNIAGGTTYGIQSIEKRLIECMNNNM